MVFYTPRIRGVILKELVLKSLSSGLSQRALADQIGVSHGTVNNIVAGHAPTKLNTLGKFLRYYHLTMEQLQSNAPSVHVQHSATQAKSMRLLALIDQLDDEERATLERCAEAFTQSTPDVRQHLIGQLKLVERLVHYEQSLSAQKKIHRKA